jgi:hypothetical protein
MAGPVDLIGSGHRFLSPNRPAYFLPGFAGAGAAAADGLAGVFLVSAIFFCFCLSFGALSPISVLSISQRGLRPRVRGRTGPTIGLPG